MTFVAIMSVREGTEEERLGRRMQWEIPEGIEVVGEYWLFTPDPECIFVFEAEDAAVLMAFSGAWNDVYDVTIYPALTAAEGMELAGEMLG